MNTFREHIHYALYAAIVLGVMIMHGSTPIVSTNSKLTIVLMSLLILGESLVRILRGKKANRRDHSS